MEPVQNGQISTTTNSLALHTYMPQKFLLQNIIYLDLCLLWHIVRRATATATATTFAGPQFIIPGCIVYDSTFKCTFNGMEWHSQCELCEQSTNRPKCVQLRQQNSFQCSLRNWREQKKNGTHKHTHTHTSESFGLEICPLMCAVCATATALVFVGSADEWGFSNDSKSKIFCY